MGQVKQNCSWVPVQNPNFRLRNAHPDWEMHPDWTAAFKHLDAYNLWICEVVMPIAFQWIEDNKEAVYRDIPSAELDDVGVVIARAFDIVKKGSAYKRGQGTASRYQAALAGGKFDPKSTNPVWQAMARDLAKGSDQVKSKYRKKFGSTIRKSRD
jgi:hypothetical protein